MRRHPSHRSLSGSAALAVITALSLEQRPAVRVAPAHIALEDIADGKTRVEKEREFYVRISDVDQLKKAAKAEKQEQWTIRLEKTDKSAGAGQFRVRRVQIGEDVKYYFTTKVIKGSGLRDENTIEVSEQMFEMFKVMAETGMIKDRYSFPVEGSDLVYEVDMFRKPDGTYHEWAKIDLENPPEQPPPLPVHVDEFIDGKTQDPDSRKRISQLYEDMFMTPNVYVNGDNVTGLPPAIQPEPTGDKPEDVIPDVPAVDAAPEKKEGESEDNAVPAADVIEAGTDSSEETDDGRVLTRLERLIARRTGDGNGEPPDTTFSEEAAQQASEADSATLDETA
jgi:hypothetical protein